MKITELIDGTLLDEMIREGYIRKTPHPSLPLFILGYSEKAQFERRWNDATVGCRGMIVDADDNIIARPWSKFFNLGEGNVIIDFEMPVEVTDKVDGSLGILYHDGEDWAIATRGSFASDQAIHATRVLRERYREFADELIVGNDFTALFEIVYPANRIVLDYGDMDDLVLLGCVNIPRGWYDGPLSAAAIFGWPGPVTKTFDYRTMREAFEADPRPNAEGFVIRSGSKLVKIKQSDYVELHRIVTNLNEKTVWELMKQGKSLYEIVKPIPDEWHEWVRQVWESINDKYADRESAILTEYSLIQPGLDRKAFAAVASKSPNKAYLFKMYDGKSIAEMVLDELKPTVSKE
jgi:RNA ligase